MKLATHHISVKGRQVAVPALEFDNLRIISRGKLLRIASIHDEEWLQESSLSFPDRVAQVLIDTSFPADIFTFAQRISDPQPRYDHKFEWDNGAAIRLTTYDAWWNQLPQVVRRNVRLAAKKEVEVKVVPFDDALIRGITALYNEAPSRLGKKFWHYGKDFETVKRENGCYLDRSEFIGAYLGGALIGFIKLVYVDRVGSVMQILAMVQHQDKRTTNALIAKAVEVCIQKGMSHLMYCRFMYGQNDSSQLIDFKKRNGFKRVDFPRYFIPLTVRGHLALSLGAQNGIKAMIPPPLFKLAIQTRARFYGLTSQDA